MSYLDFEALEKMDERAFLNRHPYPWANPAGLLTDEGFRALRESLPEAERFDRIFGKTRQHGQKPHDRLSLDYEPGMPLSPHWQAFMEELHGPEYRRFLARMLNTNHFTLKCHWHYTPASCSVSPHCDANWKLGSHIFYFNTEEDWRPEWGGQTVVLDDHGRFKTRSAPEFEEFDEEIESIAMGNQSFLFTRRGNSWHGVREITCPPEYYRKVMIVVIRDARPLKQFTKTVKNWFRRAA
ncbi:hypothetical protein [Kushneria phosphatilytica]|uniref:Uncharacterized protein n=1 Tax=Kushneria phosphatilytica TaxID=657387 RepID=A0A1S1NLU2_9GAMM|nr:hypothetical protein [Kushneria phosphatilytica]OHV07736.1 hypothetical protein BH688_16270 [Kushneria phosphatilytica]QEL10239.1 hypothetical protein FY550_03195 [Kushneria phosphatilytica]